MRTKEEETKSVVVKSFSGRQKFDGAAWSAWDYHKTKSRIHVECCKRHFDKDKVWPTDSEIAPKINTIFLPIKRKTSSNELEKELTKKKAKAEDLLPFWKKACNGIVPIDNNMEL